MKRDEVFPSKYLKAADLGGKPAVVTIKSADFETLKTPDGRENAKIVLRFTGKTKALPLNMVNWDACAEILGADSDEWIGGKIEVFPARTEMAGKSVDCIRVRRPSGALPLKKPTAKAAPSAEDHDPRDDDMDGDQIPF